MACGANCGIFHSESSIRATSLATDKEGNYLRFAGEMRGTIYLEEALVGTNSEITMPAGGLKGRIIINARNLTGDDSWTVPIKIGTGGGMITLDGDSYADANAYTQATQQLGGGSVGVVPFKLHRTDCAPAHATIIDPSSIEDTISMRHYGPVYWNSSDGQPYQVHRRKIGSTTDTWQLQDCFTCTLDSNNTIVRVSTTSVDRLQRGYEYRVSRRTKGDGSNVLRCVLPHLASSAYPEVADFDPLTFKVCDTLPIQSPGDADDDGDVDEDDASAVLANWNSTACMKYGDANRDGGVNLADVYEVDEYQGWCYCLFCELSVSSGGGNGKTTLGFAPDDDHGGATALSAPPAVAEALEIMGYSSIESFVHIVYMMDESGRSWSTTVSQTCSASDPDKPPLDTSPSPQGAFSRANRHS